jgi:DNA polymerase-3 subunit epsilon
MSLFDGTRLAVLDTETTGLDPARGHRLIEVACVALEDGRIGEAWSTLVNPGRPIPADAAAVHGITDAMVRDAPTPAAVAAELETRCAGRTLVFHHADFDLPFLKAAFGLSLFDGLADPDYLPLFGTGMIDTLGLARGLSEPGSNSLGALASRLGLPPEAPHRARGDALTTARVLLKLAERWEREQGVRTLADLAKASRDALAKSSRRPGG